MLRVLNEEAQNPNAFTIRTLGVLRYLDRAAATAFGKLQKVVLQGNFVPHQSPGKDHILTVAGLDHPTMLMLDDAGLVNSSATSEYTAKGQVVSLTCPAHSRRILIMRADREEFTMTLPVHLLTPAGEQLARIAESEQDDAVFAKLTQWVRSQIKITSQFEYSTIPLSTMGTIDVDEFEWQAF